MKYNIFIVVLLSIFLHHCPFQETLHPEKGNGVLVINDTLSVYHIDSLITDSDKFLDSADLYTGAIKNSFLIKDLLVLDTLLRYSQVAGADQLERRAFYKSGLCREGLLEDSKAIVMYKMALLCDSTHVGSFRQLSNTFRRNGDFFQAIYYASRGLSFAKSRGDSVNFYLDLSAAYTEVQRLQDALINADRGLLLANDARSKQVLYLNKASALIALKYYEQARNAYQKAADTYTEFKCEALTGVGIAYKRMGKFQAALDAIKESIKYSKGERGTAISYNNLADVFRDLNRPNPAFYYYQKAITTILPGFFPKDNFENPDTSLFKNALSKPDLMGYLRDKAYAIRNINPELAIQTYELADYACDYIRQNSAERENMLFWREEAYPLYREAIKLCHRMGDKEKAYHFFEKSRAVLLLDELNKNVLNREDSELKSRRTSKLLSLSELQKKLKPDETFIEYFTLPEEDSLKKDPLREDSLFVFTVTSSEYHFDTLYYRRDSVVQYIENIRTNPNTIKRKISPNNLDRYLYKKLIKKLNLSQNTKHLIISADGELQSLPFEALKNDHNYLLLDYAIRYAYSASTLYFENPIGKKNDKRLVCVAPIDFSRYPSLRPLKESEVRSDSFKQRGNVVFQKAEATKKNFIQAAVQGVDILQLMTHAKATGGEEPCIYFYDTLLTLSELYNLKIPSKLAVLTACETGIGKDARGEGVQSLAHGFAYAGVPATVATLWSVLEWQTLTINQSFYKNLQKGMTKSEALQKAKITFLDDNPNSNPYFWAAPILYGDDSSIDTNSTGMFWYIIVLIILGALVFFKIRNMK